MFYHTKFTISVLSDEPMADGIALSDLEYFLTDGDGSGKVTQGESVPITRKELQDLCNQHGTDISFFVGDEDDE